MPVHNSNSQPAIYSAHFNPAQALDRAALAYPNRANLICEEKILTVSESARITRQIAELLLTDGVCAGERVAFISRNSPYHLLIHAACARIGAIFVAISYRLQRRELTQQLNLAMPKVIIADWLTVDSEKIVCAQLAFSPQKLYCFADGSGQEHLDNQDLPCKGDLPLKIEICTDGSVDASGKSAMIADLTRQHGFLPFIPAYRQFAGGLLAFTDRQLSQIGMSLPQNCESILAARDRVRLDSWQKDPAQQSKALVPNPLLLGRTRYPDGKAVILFTSGSVGVPKAVALTHEQLFWGSQNLRDGFEYSTFDPEIVVAPLTHIGGFNGTTLDLFSHGGTVVIMPEFDPGKLLELIEKHRIAMMFGVPTIYAAMLNHPDLAWRDISSFRLPLIGGAAASATLLQRMAAVGLRPINVWGMTETAASGCCLSSENCFAAVGSIGVPFPRIAVRIVNPQTGVDSADGTGELVLCGPSVIREYWNDPQTTCESFDGPWLHTGDLVRLTADGNLWVTGRIHNLINTGGEKVAPEEVENVLSEYPGVSECAVIGVPHEHWGEAVTAVLVMQCGAQVPSLVQLREFAREKLADYKLPKSVFAVNEFPLTANGKIDRKALSALLRNMRKNSQYAQKLSIRAKTKR